MKLLCICRFVVSAMYIRYSIRLAYSKSVPRSVLF